jgi:hypothetical protein
VRAFGYFRAAAQRLRAGGNGVPDRIPAKGEPASSILAPAWEDRVQIRLAEGVAGTVLVAGAIALQLPMCNRSVVPLDEGQMAAIAARLLRGDALYRDIHTGVFPGVYYVTAALLGAIRHDIVVTRIAQVGVNTAVALMLWRLGCRAVGWRWALLSPALYLLLVAAGFPVLTMLNYSSLSMALGLAALLWLLRYLESGRSAGAVATGALVAAATLVKQNFGVLALLAIFGALFLERRRSALAGRSALSSAAPIVAGGAAVATVALLHFVWLGTLDDLIQKTILGLGPSQLHEFDNPIPPVLGPLPDDLRFKFLYTPPILFNYGLHGADLFGVRVTPGLQQLAVRLSYGLPLAALALTPLVAWWSRSEPSGRRTASEASGLFAVVLFLGIFPSAIWSHLAFVLPPVLLVMGLLIATAGTRIGRWRTGAGRAWATGWAVLAASGIVVSGRVSLDLMRWYSEPSEVPHLSLRLAPIQAAVLRDAAGFVEECAGPGEPIFVLPDIPHIYFATGRPNPTPYDLFVARDADPVRAVAILEDKKPRCVVFNPNPYPEFAPFPERFPELADYLSSRYEMRRELGPRFARWEGLVRRADPEAAE